MGFARENARQLQETDLTTFASTCIGEKLAFTGASLNDMTELPMSCCDTESKIRHKGFR